MPALGLDQFGISNPLVSGYNGRYNGMLGGGYGGYNGGYGGGAPIPQSGKGAPMRAIGGAIQAALAAYQNTAREQFQQKRQQNIEDVNALNAGAPPDGTIVYDPTDQSQVLLGKGGPTVKNAGNLFSSTGGDPTNLQGDITGPPAPTTVGTGGLDPATIRAQIMAGMGGTSSTPNNAEPGGVDLAGAAAGPGNAMPLVGPAAPQAGVTPPAGLGARLLAAQAAGAQAPQQPTPSAASAPSPNALDVDQLRQQIAGPQAGNPMSSPAERSLYITPGGSTYIPQLSPQGRALQVANMQTDRMMALAGYNQGNANFRALTADQVRQLIASGNQDTRRDVANIGVGGRATEGAANRASHETIADAHQADSDAKTELQPFDKATTPITTRFLPAYTAFTSALQQAKANNATATLPLAQAYVQLASAAGGRSGQAGMVKLGLTGVDPSAPGAIANWLSRKTQGTQSAKTLDDMQQTAQAMMDSNQDVYTHRWNSLSPQAQKLRQGQEPTTLFGSGAAPSAKTGAKSYSPDNPFAP